MSTISEALKELKESEREKETKSVEYAKAFLDRLPFKLDGEPISEGEELVRKRMNKSAYDDKAIVEITHHNNRVDANFHEEYIFNDDGTFTCIAEGFPYNGPNNDFGDGFSETKRGLKIDQLFSVTRILANVKDSKNIYERLPELIATFASI